MVEALIFNAVKAFTLIQKIIIISKLIWIPSIKFFRLILDFVLPFHQISIVFIILLPASYLELIFILLLIYFFYLKVYILIHE